MDDGGAGEGRRDALRRLRWRRRGAWLWPAFVVVTVLEMGLLHWLPLAGEQTGFIGALLLAGTLNIIAIALLGSLGGALLRRRRRDLPKVVADDYAGLAVLGLVAAVFVAVGLAHRPELEDRKAAFAEQSRAVREWVAREGDAYTRAHVDLADSIAVDDELFRTCIPGPDAKRFVCLYVDTSRSPPAVKRDTSRESNAAQNPRGSFR